MLGSRHLVGLVLLFTIANFWVWGVAYYAMRAIFWIVNRALAAKYGRHARATAAVAARPAHFASTS